MSFRGQLARLGIVISGDVVDITRTLARTTGSLRSVSVSQTMTGEASTNQVEGLKVKITSDVKTGAWCNAITAALDYSTNGAAHGEAGPLYAELTLPNSSLRRGELYGLGIGIGVGASSSWGSAGPVSFIKFDAWGTLANLNAHGYLFHLAGITDTANGLFDVIAAAGFDGCIKILIGSTEYFIPVSLDNAFV